MSALGAVAFETYYLGLRTTRRFFRVPSNWSASSFSRSIQLLVFSQLYQHIVQLPAFDGQSSYLAYLAPGQIAFTAFMAVAWSAYGIAVEYRTGYLDKLRASPIARWSILAGEMVPLFFQAAIMAGVLLVVSLLLGATLVTGVGGFLLILALSGGFGIAFAGTSFIPALLTKSEQATSTLSLLMFPVVFMSTAFVPAGADAGLDAGGQQVEPDHLPHRGDPRTHGDRLRLGRDRRRAALDGNHRRRPAGDHAVGVLPSGALTRLSVLLEPRIPSCGPRDPHLS